MTNANHHANHPTDPVATPRGIDHIVAGVSTSDGQIDADRIKWIAEGIRGISRNQREVLLKGVAAAKFTAPEAVSQ